MLLLTAVTRNTVLIQLSRKVVISTKAKHLQKLLQSKRTMKMLVDLTLNSENMGFIDTMVLNTFLDISQQYQTINLMTSEEEDPTTTTLPPQRMKFQRLQWLLMTLKLTPRPNRDRRRVLRCPDAGGRHHKFDHRRPRGAPPRPPVVSPRSPAASLAA